MESSSESALRPDWYAPTVLIQAATSTAAAALGWKKNKKKKAGELQHRDTDKKPTAYSMIQLLRWAQGKQNTLS